MKKEKSIATLSVHAGDQRDRGHNAIFPPITTASSFIQDNLGKEGDFCYARCGNPTRYAYESALAELEAGIYATATSSGMAASALIMELFPKDSHIVVMCGVYGGTYRLFERLRKYTSGMQFSYVNLNDLQAVKNNIQDNTQLIWIETPTNPLLELVDIESICKLAKELAVKTCVDNTFASAWNQRPLTLGADIVMLSTSKYIGGHSDLIGGAVITNDSIIADKLDFCKTTVGAVASPFDAYLALRGMKTLDVRMERQCHNALHIASYLETHPKVIAVHYPGLRSHPQYTLCKKQMRSGGAVVTIRLKGSRLDVEKFIPQLKYFVLAESLGGVESMINHSASMSHGSMTKEEKEKMGIYDTTLRLSAGIEDVNDLIEDLKHALSFIDN